MTITSTLFDAFLKCPTKCFLLSVGESGPGNVYADWVRAQKESFRADGIRRLCSERHPEECVTSPQLNELKGGKWRLAVNVLARTQRLESQIDALARAENNENTKWLLDLTGQASCSAPSPYCLWALTT